MRVDFDVREDTKGMGFLYGAFPLCGMTLLGTARFAFPLQFITTLEWAGLFTCRYSCAASTDVTPEKLFLSASFHQALTGSARRLSTREQSVLPQQTTKGALIQNSCVRSFADCADLSS